MKLRQSPHVAPAIQQTLWCAGPYNTDVLHRRGTVNRYTTTMQATSVSPSFHVTMSTQLTATWALAMCAMVIMVTFSVVAWKLNRNGKLVHKTTGLPYDAAPQFNSSQFENPSGTHHFFPGNGSVMARLEDHDCETKNCERKQMIKNGVALQNQHWTRHHGASRRIVPDGNRRSRFDS